MESSRNSDRQARLDPSNPLQEATGGAVISGVFELLAEQQVRFYSLIRYTNSSNAAMEIHLENLSTSRSIHIANVETNGTGVFLESSLLLPPGSYRWKSQAAIRSGGYVNGPNQKGYAKIETGAFSMSTAGGGNNFSLVSGGLNRNIKVSGVYHVYLNPGEIATARSSSQLLPSGPIIETADVTANSQGHHSINTGMLDLYLRNKEIYQFKTLYTGGRINGVYLNISM